MRPSGSGGEGGDGGGGGDGWHRSQAAHMSLAQVSGLASSLGWLHRLRHCGPAGDSGDGGGDDGDGVANGGDGALHRAQPWHSVHKQLATGSASALRLMHRAWQTGPAGAWGGLEGGGITQTVTVRVSSCKTPPGQPGASTCAAWTSCMASATACATSAEASVVPTIEERCMCRRRITLALSALTSEVSLSTASYLWSMAGAPRTGVVVRKVNASAKRADVERSIVVEIGRAHV